jgi:hypothetical protein
MVNAMDYEAQSKIMNAPKISALDEVEKFCVPWGDDANFALLGVIFPSPTSKRAYVGPLAFAKHELDIFRIKKHLFKAGFDLVEIITTEKYSSELRPSFRKFSITEFCEKVVEKRVKKAL